MKRRAIYALLACGLALPVPFLPVQPPAGTIEEAANYAQSYPVTNVDVFTLLAQKSH